MHSKTGEKPFGIDLGANVEIMKHIKEHPQVLVRCSSEFPYYPGAQKIVDLISKGVFGTVIDVYFLFCVCLVLFCFVLFYFGLFFFHVAQTHKHTTLINIRLSLVSYTPPI
jgi:hypothetical protein